MTWRPLSEKNGFRVGHCRAPLQTSWLHGVPRPWRAPLQTTWLQPCSRPPPPMAMLEVACGCYAAGPREQSQAVLRYAQPVMLLTAGCSIMGSSNILMLVSRIDSVVV